MLSPSEIALLLALAKDYYTEGEKASTSDRCSALARTHWQRDSRKTLVSSTSKRIHSCDLFLAKGMGNPGRTFPVRSSSISCARCRYSTSMSTQAIFDPFAWNQRTCSLTRSMSTR